ncbi:MULTISPECIES: hypothetical protein [Streptosporangium]|uniref:DUF4268 domain-containing protein n=1 Tax=Streptosporangium brasiliense TaxID=47480 RepID=A0ABT9RM68_9ACTN|nr:hypothetical protein [Streptosporangium brasiliense]MDP9870389.1 hypothetical protein [Streptosporangium brasiliense]
MAISWRKYRNTGEIFGRVYIEHRYGLYDLVNILAKYAHENNDAGPFDELDVTKPLSKTSAEKYIREQLHEYGHHASWLWRDNTDEDMIEMCFAWGRETAIRIWPEFADQFAEVSG